MVDLMKPNQWYMPNNFGTWDIGLQNIAYVNSAWVGWHMMDNDMMDG